MAILSPHNAYGAHVARDLEWVIFSPNMLINSPSPDLSSLPQSRKIVDDVRQTPDRLLSYISTMKRQNLGTYFEHLVFYWLECLDDVEIIDRNIQVYSDKKTIGEIDLLFRYQKQIYHWELSVKFYANIGSGLEEEKWIGPLKKDNLKRKLDRLFDHQLPLLQKLGADQVPLPVEPNKIKSSPFVKGILFSKASDLPPLIFPKRISPSCLMSNWCFLQDLQNYLPPKTSHYKILSKSQWLSGGIPGNWKTARSVTDLLVNLTNELLSSQSPLLVVFSEEPEQEHSPNAPIFVMHNDWLDSP